MESFEKWLRLVAPAGWEDVAVRTVKVALVAFVMLHVKEYVDAGFPLDTPDIAIDALWIGGGSLVLNTILMWVKP